MKLSITPQATVYWASADIGFTEIQSDLDSLWAQKETSKQPMPKLSNALPKNRETYEKHALTDLYRDYWTRLLAENVQNQTNRPVCYVNDIEANKIGGIYHVTAQVYFEPLVIIDDVTWSNAERSFGKIRVTNDEIVESLARVRAKHIFNQALEYVDGEPLKMGDIVNVLADPEEVKRHTMLARRMIIELNDTTCDEQWKSALLGKKIGNEINLTIKINENDPNEGVFVAKLKIQNKIKPQDLSDEALCQLENVENIAKLKEKLAIDIENFKKTNNGYLIFQFLMRSFKMEPVPGPLIHDHATGYIAAINRAGTVPEDLNGLSPEQMHQAVMPKIRIQYVSSLIAKMACARYKIEISKEDVLKRLKKDVQLDTWETEYLAFCELAHEKALEHFKNGMADSAVPKLILPGDKDFTVPPDPKKSTLVLR